MSRYRAMMMKTALSGIWLESNELYCTLFARKLQRVSSHQQLQRGVEAAG